MNPGDSSLGEVALCETPKPRRCLGALLARVYEVATHRATLLWETTRIGVVKQEPS